MSADYELVTEHHRLLELVDRFLLEPCVAVDTEFVWDRTYYARLGLVQVGLSDRSVFLLDPVAIGDLTPFGRVLGSDRVIKILHDAPQDLMLLLRATGSTSRRIFDTRLAAGFAGLSSTTSLQGLLLELFGFELPKGAQRTDWMRRPLSQSQLDYAADDVLFLPRAMEVLRGRARERATETWLDQELATLDASVLYEERPPEEAFLRLKGGGRMRRRELAVLREVAAWREREARELDRPRRRLLEDRDLVAVAQACPRTEEELSRCHLHPGQLRHFGQGLIDAVRKGLDVPDDACPMPLRRPDSRRVGKGRIDEVWTRIRQLFEEARVDPDLSASKAEVTRLLTEGSKAQSEDHRPLQGWRHTILEEYLAGELRAGQMDLL